MFAALTTRLHSSWLIALASGGLMVGVACAAWYDVSFFAQVSWLLTGAALCLFAIVRQQRWAIVCALLGGLLLGAWRGGGEQQQLAVYDELVGSSVTLTGTVAEDADADARGNTKLRLKSIRVNGQPLHGVLWLSIQTKSDVWRSDVVTVQGTLRQGFGSFAATMPDAQLVKVQRPTPGDVALRVRDWFAQAIRTVIPEPEASLGIGYLVGQRRALPPELDEALRVAGLTHIVVASGYNLTILVRLARRLFEKVSKYLSTLSASVLIAGFIAVTGMSPSMSRAGLVAGLSLAAWYYGRKFHPLVLLPFAAAVTVLVNPSYAWGDVGWQLSFAAFVGVMLLAPLGQAYFFGAKKPGLVRQILGETIAATVATLPILLLHFGAMSNVALFANLLILPLVPLAMLLTAIAGVGSLTLPLLGTVGGFFATALLAYMVWVAQFFAGLPWASSEVHIGIGQVAIVYGVLALLMLYWQRATGYSLRNANIVE